MRPQYCPSHLLPPPSAGNLKCPQCLDEICISCLHSPCFPVLPLPPMAEQKTRPKPGEVVSLGRQPCDVEAPGISYLTEVCLSQIIIHSVGKWQKYRLWWKQRWMSIQNLPWPASTWHSVTLKEPGYFNIDIYLVHCILLNRWIYFQGHQI